MKHTNEKVIMLVVPEDIRYLLYKLIKRPFLSNVIQENWQVYQEEDEQVETPAWAEHAVILLTRRTLAKTRRSTPRITGGSQSHPRMCLKSWRQSFLQQSWSSALSAVKVTLCHLAYSLRTSGWTITAIVMFCARSRKLGSTG